jgi:hypothetical protein
MTYRLAAENGSNGGSPPARASVGCGCPIGVEVVSDLSEAETGVTRVTDPLDDIGRDRLRPAGSLWLEPRLRRASPLEQDPLELVSRDQFRSPRSLDCLDVRQHPLREGRPADPERLCRLGARVRQPLDVACLANDDLGGIIAKGSCGTERLGRQAERVGERRSRSCRVTLRLGDLAPETTARHAYTVQERQD